MIAYAYLRIIITMTLYYATMHKDTAHKLGIKCACIRLNVTSVKENQGDNSCRAECIHDA